MCNKTEQSIKHSNESRMARPEKISHKQVSDKGDVSWSTLPTRLNRLSW